MECNRKQPSSGKSRRQILVEVSADIAVAQQKIKGIIEELDQLVIEGRRILSR